MPVAIWRENKEKAIVHDTSIPVEVEVWEKKYEKAILGTMFD